MAKSPRKPEPTPDGDAVDPSVAALGFEEAIERLESIIDRMERGETGLEESLKEYAVGDQLIRRCRQILESAEQRIQSIAGRDLDDGGTA